MFHQTVRNSSRLAWSNRSYPVRLEEGRSYVDGQRENPVFVTYSASRCVAFVFVFHSEFLDPSSPLGVLGIGERLHCVEPAVFVFFLEVVLG